MARDFLLLFGIFSKITKRPIIFPILRISVIYATLYCLYGNTVEWLVPNSSVYSYNTSITLNFLSRVRLIFNRETSKNIYYGKYDEGDIVIKEYPRRSECGGMDTKQCVQIYTDFATSLQDAHLKSLVVCPCARSVGVLVENMDEFRSISFDSMTEPILLKMLPSSQGWPVPGYVGMWNNVLFEEYVGPSLSSVTLNSWQRRILISSKLLAMAEKFTFQHPVFAFYFTDISPDNISLREDMEAVLVDLDHVIVVDRVVRGVEKPPLWDTLHISEIFEDEDKFIFSTEDICQHSLSDHNYFSVCEHILARSSILGQGLLANIPVELDKKYPELKILLQECARPRNFSDRISAGKRLQNTLENILQSESKCILYFIP